MWRQLSNLWRPLIWLLLLTLNVTTIANAPMPFLLGTTSQFLSRAVASASGGSQPAASSYIADLRHTSALNSDKSANKVDDQKLDDDDFFKEALEIDAATESTHDNDDNEAAPSLIQKKIDKILSKLRYLAKLVPSSTTDVITTSNNNNGVDGDDDDFQKEQDDFDKEFDEDFADNTNNATTIEIVDILNNNNNNNKAVKLVASNGYSYDRPSRKAQKLQESVAVDSNNGTGNRISFNPANIGVFFVELLGSLVGLAYGAAAQLNNRTAAPSTEIIT